MKMARVYNFSAGPATLPLWTLEQAQKELLDYKNTGMSIMETSHRAKSFDNVIKETEKDLRELWNIPNNFKVLFLQGGASSQFFMVPMNIAGNKPTDYVITGAWTEKAIKEAKILGKSANVAADTKDSNHNRIPKQDELKLTSDAAYTFITSNNTIFGTQWKNLPKSDAPLVIDMSSDILGYKIDFSNIGIIFAGAQKNLGPSGLTLVIIREDLIKDVENVPSMLKYKTHADKDSLYNTPPTFSIYMLSLTLKWIKNMGGIDKIAENNEKKAGFIYDAIDNSNGFYKGHADKDSRSLMNITFTLANKDLEAKFVEEAGKLGFSGLKGHRSVGGCRASIYNAMPTEGCEKLAEFMKKFQTDNQ